MKRHSWNWPPGRVTSNCIDSLIRQFWCPDSDLLSASFESFHRLLRTSFVAIAFSFIFQNVPEICKVYSSLFTQSGSMFHGRKLLVSLEYVGCFPFFSAWSCLHNSSKERLKFLEVSIRKSCLNLLLLLNMLKDTVPIAALSISDCRVRRWVANYRSPFHFSAMSTLKATVIVNKMRRPSCTSTSRITEFR